MNIFILASQASRKSAETRVNLVARGPPWDLTTSRANFLHLEAQINLKVCLILGSGAIVLSVSVNVVSVMASI